MAERAVYRRDGESECMVLGENHHDIMTITIFRRFLGYSLMAGVITFYCSSGAAAALAAYSPRAARTVA